MQVMVHQPLGCVQEDISNSMCNLPLLYYPCFLLYALSTNAKASAQWDLLMDWSYKKIPGGDQSIAQTLPLRLWCPCTLHRGQMVGTRAKRHIEIHGISVVNQHILASVNQNTAPNYFLTEL